MPKTYYDLKQDYLVTLYGTGIFEICNRLEIPRDVADRQQKAIYENLLRRMKEVEVTEAISGATRRLPASSSR